MTVKELMTVGSNLAKYRLHERETIYYEGKNMMSREDLPGFIKPLLEARVVMIRIKENQFDVLISID